MRILSVIILILAISGSSDATSRILMAEKTGEVKPNSLADPPALTPTPLHIPKKSREPEQKKNPPPLLKETKIHDQQLSQGPSGSNKDLVESCDASSLATCHANHGLVACLRHQKTDSKDLVLLVHNKRENNLSVLINAPASAKIGLKSVNLTKHGAEKINISSDATNNLKIVLNSGKENCVLEIPSPIPGWRNPFQQYAEHLTPINGSYILFATATVVACAWACCKFVIKGRRADDGISYQQLEMGTQSPESSSVIVEPSTGDGWDQGWDDDWDEEGATERPSNSGPNGNVSSNGLTSRPTGKKNDWDADWDD